jgi:hypothetical protein
MENETIKDLKKKFFLLFVVVLFLFSFVSSLPEGPSLSEMTNSTKTSSPAVMINTSGGYISTVNLSLFSQNVRWKAFVGNVTGSFSLEDASGSMIYDWSLTTIGGQVYATRNDTSSIAWTSIVCASTAVVESENAALNHTGSIDNITATFSSGDHFGFSVGGQVIADNACDHSLYTYDDSGSQTSFFSEVIVTDGASGLIYVTKIEDDETGYNGASYDFQMMVPEVGLGGWTGSTAYYLYVELLN